MMGCYVFQNDEIDKLKNDVLQSIVNNPQEEISKKGSAL